MSVLDWHDAQHFDRTRDLPCALCARPTPMRSHHGEPVHKVCAEDWNDQHPEAPRHRRGNRDHGTGRFHNDPPKK
ncbi:hypothetical protein [Streptomyces aureus]|uniref:Uncharacterized protein n=1 Tax=Streptomyces aureus TaxID=193461 RepID=A0ABV4SJZ2_9ACTN